MHVQVLPQITLKRHQLQMLPYLSCGSEIVHPIVEQNDEQMSNDNSGRFLHQQDSGITSIISPLINNKAENENISSSSNSNSNHDRSLSTGGYEDRFLRYSIN